MKTAWICDTPYQTLNCLNYVLNDKICNQNDLYIGTNFNNAKFTINNIKNSNIFNYVFPHMPPLEGDEDGFKRWGVVKKVAGFLFPGYRVRRQLIEKTDFQKIPLHYDRLFMSVGGALSTSLSFYSHVKQIFYYDDGLGSYIKDISKRSLFKTLMYKIRFCDVKWAHPSGLYLNNINMINSEMNFPVYSLPALSQNGSEKFSLLKDIFGYINDDHYRKYDVIYLAQPANKKIKYFETIQNRILDNIISLHFNVLVRPHPKQDLYKISKYTVDTHRDMWEFVCSDQITDRHILVGSFSTAQIIPKMLYDKEPFIVFTYKLFSQDSNNQESLDSFVQKIVSCYRRPEKVVNISTIEGLVAFFTHLASFYPSV